MTRKTRQNFVIRKCMLNQTYILYFYIRTGKLVINPALISGSLIKMVFFQVFQISQPLRRFILRDRKVKGGKRSF